VADLESRLAARLADVRHGPRQFAQIARMWVRAGMVYRTSFWTLTVANGLITVLDFVGLALMFHTIDRLGGFELREVALLYGLSGFGIGFAHLFIGTVEEIGTHVRSGTLDTMLTRPVPLIVQIGADRFAFRQLGRVTQSLIVLGYGAGAVSWTPGRALLLVVAAAGASAIFLALFIGFSCLQFWTVDAGETSNAFTYGGNTMTQYPLTIFPREVLKSLTFVIPIAFVNWYPCLALLDRPDPFGMPSWFAYLSPLVAIVTLALAGLAWRTGLRHYTSTGS
jgi:ABC-2 type transport system permease protein